MPRAAREKSSTGIYHVMLRGINHQVIFEEDEDYQRYIDTLATCQKKSEFTLYAYCLMSNHIHLLMKEEREELGIIFRRIGASFVYWYNWKYGRSGHLFQDRYKSEVVEDDTYFLAVLRYIHQNPLKAKMVPDMGAYQWSSYAEYTGKRGLCDVNFGLDLLSPSRQQAIERFTAFHQQEGHDECLQFDPSIRLNDTDAAVFIAGRAGVQRPTEIKALDKDKRNEIIKACRDRGLSIRQIERVTGIGAGVIRKI